MLNCLLRKSLSQLSNLSTVCVLSDESNLLRNWSTSSRPEDNSGTYVFKSGCSFIHVSQLVILNLSAITKSNFLKILINMVLFLGVQERERQHKVFTPFGSIRVTSPLCDSSKGISGTMGSSCKFDKLTEYSLIHFQRAFSHDCVGINPFPGIHLHPTSVLSLHHNLMDAGRSCLHKICSFTSINCKNPVPAI